MNNFVNRECLKDEVVLTAVRSSGAGGQHVNKTSTKIQLRFKVDESSCLTIEQKELINTKLSNRINNDGVVVLFSQDTRSALRNREIIIDKLVHLLNNALVLQTERKSTKPSKRSIKKRLENKRRLAEKKKMRRRVDGYAG